MTHSPSSAAALLPADARAALGACEHRILAPWLALGRGRFALDLAPAGWPDLIFGGGSCLRLRQARDGLKGDLTSRPHAWPLRDGSIDLLVLRHVGCDGEDAEALLSEAVRVLAPGGRMLWLGLRPWTLWHGWLALHHSPAMAALAPRGQAWMSRRLRAAGLQVCAHRRYGNAVPGPGTAQADHGHLLSPCVLIEARKQDSGMVRLRFARPAVVRHRAPPLAASSSRQCLRRVC